MDNAVFNSTGSAGVWNYGGQTRVLYSNKLTIPNIILKQWPYYKTTANGPWLETESLDETGSTTVDGSGNQASNTWNMNIYVSNDNI